MKTKENQYMWGDFYSDLATQLLDYENKQEHLITILSAVGVNPGTDKATLQSPKTPLKDIDPFTFISRVTCVAGGSHGSIEKLEDSLNKLKNQFKLKSNLPKDFSELPVPQWYTANFFANKYQRADDDIPSLWKLARAALLNECISAKIFERCLRIKNVGIEKLTMGMFWLNSKKYFITTESSDLVEYIK